MQETAKARDPYASEDIGTKPENAACDDTSSAAELRECTEQTRASIERNLRRIEESFSPGQLWHRLRRQIDRKGETFDLRQAVGRNPVPLVIVGSGLALIGAGIAVYAFTKMRANDRNGTEEREPPAAPRNVTMEEYGLDHGAEPIVTPPPEGEPQIIEAATDVPGVASAPEDESIQEIEEAKARKDEEHSEFAYPEEKKGEG